MKIKWNGEQRRILMDGDVEHYFKPGDVLEVSDKCARYVISSRCGFSEVVGEVTVDATKKDYRTVAEVFANDVEIGGSDVVAAPAPQEQTEPATVKRGRPPKSK